MNHKIRLRVNPVSKKSSKSSFELFLKKHVIYDTCPVAPSLKSKSQDLEFKDPKSWRTFLFLHRKYLKSPLRQSHLSYKVTGVCWCTVQSHGVYYGCNLSCSTYKHLVFTTRKQAKGPGQRYQLLLQPVLMPRISNSCKSSWYLFQRHCNG